MSTKKRFVYFIVLFLPMLIVSALVNLVYSLQMHEFIQLNWYAVGLLAIALDALITWMQTRKKEDKDAL
jgi:hypothetical protein